MPKVHSTNYTNTLIMPAPDCKEVAAPPKNAGTVGAMQFDRLADPYQLTGDDLLVAVTAARREIPQDEIDDLRDALFSKGQPCLRASSLVKSLGWALHYDGEGKIALIDPASVRCADLLVDPTIAQLQGMRNKRASSVR